MKTFTKVTSVFLALLIVLFILPVSSTSAHATTAVKRLGGSSRIETALTIAREGWSSADTVILANAYNFADALAGVPLAAVMDAPILLSMPDALPGEVLSQIQAFGTSKVIILGGTSALSINIESALSSANVQVLRIAGANRYDTSVYIADYMRRFTGDPAEVFLASGANFADALSVSPVAGAKKCPVLYANPSGNLDSSVSEFLYSLNSPAITVLGGSAAISDKLDNDLRNSGFSNTTRVSGSDRYQTAVAICRQFNSTFSGSGVSLATGTSFPDALAGGVFAAKNRIPVILVSSRINIETADYFKTRNPDTVYVFGGESAVPDVIVADLLNNAHSGTTTTATTTAVTLPTSSGTTAVPTIPTTATTTLPTTTTTTAPSNTPAILVSKNSITTGSSETVTVTVVNPPEDYMLNCSIDDSNHASSKWGEWSGLSVPLTLTAKEGGTTLITVSLEVNEQPICSQTITFTSTNRTHQYPSFSVTMADKTFPDTSIVLVVITNHGDHSLRVHSKRAHLSDSTSSVFDRDLVLLNVDALDYNRIEFFDYVDIAPGETRYCYFYTYTDTWVDRKSTVRYEITYDGKSYAVYSSNYYGTTVY